MALRVALADAPLGMVGWELSREPHPPHLAPTATLPGCDKPSRRATRWSSPSRHAARPWAREAEYAVIAKAHRAWWAAYWQRAYVCVDDAALEKWWYTSLYLCASTIEPDYQSPGLQGVWIKENVPAWCGDYHTNVNLQSVYWGLYAANRVDFLEPFVHLLHDMAPRCRQDTRGYYGMRGIRFPHAGGIDGGELTTGPWSLLGISVGGSGWRPDSLAAEGANRWAISRNGRAASICCTGRQSAVSSR
ncbi:MAG TPA: hypothetical protein PLZ36_08660 [Armatimonadota bacterium]|nr:hypothetical protein [Armatimonadota bacterium]